MPPNRARSTTAWAVWWLPSSTISHSTPGAARATGSLEPNTSSSSPSAFSWVGTCPNSGRGANSSRTGTDPVTTRISVVSGGEPSSQSVTVRPDHRVSTVMDPGR